MDAQLEDKIDKFCFMSSIRGYNFSEMYSFDDVLETLEWYSSIRKDPNKDPEVYAAIVAHEQGISLKDFHIYFDLKERRREEDEERREAEELRALEEQEKVTPEYVKLQTINKVEHFESKQYPKCYHFKFIRFVKKKPVEVICRIYNIDYRKYRIWYSWKDPVTNKIQKHKFEDWRRSGIYAPWVMSFRKEDWRINDYWLSHMFAYAMTTNWQGPFKNLVKPGVSKKKDKANEV